MRKLLCSIFHRNWNYGPIDDWPSSQLGMRDLWSHVGPWDSELVLLQQRRAAGARGRHERGNCPQRG